MLEGGLNTAFNEKATVGPLVRREGFKLRGQLNACLELELIEVVGQGEHESVE